MSRAMTMPCAVLASVGLLAGLGAVAADTGVPPAVLSVRTAGPVGGGAVAPAGVRQIREAGDDVTVTATPSEGFLFSGWTVRGNGSLDDAAAPTATVTLVGNVDLTAHFREAVPAATVTVGLAADPAIGGAIVPDAAAVTATAGSLLDLAATANPGYRFQGWTVAGGAEVLDPHLPATMAAISGPAVLTAVFAEEADTVGLTVASGTGGTVRQLGDYELVTPTSFALTALPDLGYFFQRWETGGGVALADEFGVETEATVSGPGAVTAVFLEDGETFSHKGRKLTIVRKFKGIPGAPPADGLKLAQLPLDLHPEEFNPNTDEIRITIDGVGFVANAANGIYKVLPIGYSHTVKDPVTKSKRKLVLNFTASTWSFQAGKVDLAGIDNRDGVFVAMHVNGRTFGEKYDMDESFSWTFDPKRDAAVAAPVGGEAMPTCVFAKITGRTGNKKAGKDSLKVSSSRLALPGGRAFGPAADAVVLRVDRQEIVLPAGSFAETKPGVFLCDDVPRGIKVLIDGNAGQWSFEHKKFSGWGTVDPGDGVAVVLSIGGAQAGQALATAFSQKLTFDYKKFFWGKPIPPL